MCKFCNKGVVYSFDVGLGIYSYAPCQKCNKNPKKDKTELKKLADKWGFKL